VKPPVGPLFHPQIFGPQTQILGQEQAPGKAEKAQKKQKTFASHNFNIGLWGIVWQNLRQKH
jgi:hypothetical protein